MKIPHIENVYVSVQNACNARTKELYPHGIPTLAQKRLEKELEYLKASAYLDDFEIYRQVSAEAQKCCQYITLRGTLSGSYLIFLMGSGRYNPLPQHYYCPKCGHFETISTRLPGIDLPEKECPACGAIIQGDGFNLPIESVWGLHGKKLISFEYNICEDFKPFIKKVLTRLYPKNPIVPCGVMTARSMDENYQPESIEIVPSGFIILPKGQVMEDYPELLTYFEDGEPCLSGDMRLLEEHALKRIFFFEMDILSQLLSLQGTTGTYITELELKDLKECSHHDLVNSRILGTGLSGLISYMKPKNFYETMQYIAMSHNSFKDFHPTKQTFPNELDKFMFSTPEYKQYPCAAREDFYDFLMETGCSSEEAFTISEFIRKGRAARDSAFDSYEIPAELKTLAKKFMYVFPRAHVVEYALLYTRMAYYMKLDSKAYGKIVFKNVKIPLV